MKKAGLYLTFFFLLGTVTLLLCELVLRLFPGPWNPEIRWVDGRHPGIIDTIMGPWNKPNFTGSYRTSEFFVRNIHWNQFGMRDLPRQIAKKEGRKRIAVLGDSFMEAVQVVDTQTMARRLEARLSPTWEVLNFGKGGIGTCEEYLVYQYKARQFQPDVVLLVFWPGNDILNNSLELVEGAEGLNKRLIHAYFVRDSAAGGWRLKPASPHPDLPPVKRDFRYFLKQHTALYRFWRFFRDTWQPKHAPPWLGGRQQALALRKEAERKALPFELRWKGYGQYVPPRTRQWREAWEVTAWCLEKLREAIAQDGGRLIIVAIPPVIDTLGRRAHLAQAVGESLPPDFSWTLPARKMREIADTTGIAFVDLLPGFLEYARTTSCEPPCFFWKRDGHWNAVGHEVAADILVEELGKMGIFKDPSPPQ